MIHAELHGKCGQLRGSEDALSSSVFGLLRYRCMRPYLAAFFGRACPYFEEDRPIYCLQNVLTSDDLVVSFWKKFQCGSEVDLVLESESASLVVFVEIKYLSDISGDDQLTRYFKALEYNYAATRSSRYLIYLTADAVRPDVDKQVAELRGNNFYWLSWLELYPVLPDSSFAESPAGEIAQDLKHLLEKRYLIPFRGFSMPPDNLRLPETPSFWQGGGDFFSDYSVVKANMHFFTTTSLKKAEA